MLKFPYDEEICGDSSVPALPATPQITATNAQEPGRIERVTSTFGGACAAVRLLSNRYRNAWDGAIVALHDHKGTLEVTWRDEASRIMFEGAIMGSWEWHGEHMGKHELAS